MSDVIYLDHNATTPCDPRVLEIMLPYFTQHFGNPSSESHQAGRDARKAVEKARKQVARLIGGDARGLKFTSGATEALSWVLQSLVWQGLQEDRDELIVCATEHKAVLATAEAMARRHGTKVVVLPVDSNGLASPEELRGLITERTVAVAVMAANNETGVLGPVAEVAAVCRAAGVPYVCDATQMIGKLPFNAKELAVDYVALSSHKMYGPKGIGALWAGRAARKRKLEPLIYGGGQESGWRSGTVAVPLVVGFGAAAEFVLADMPEESDRLRELRDLMERELLAKCSDLSVNGGGVERLPDTLSASFPGVDAVALLNACLAIAASPGSACTSINNTPSHVLSAMSISPRKAQSAIRFSLGRTSRRSDLLDSTISLGQAYRLLQSLSLPEDHEIAQ